ncbi:MAG: glycosyltransferase family 2 protein [Acidobacteriota bacterium]
MRTAKASAPPAGVPDVNHPAVSVVVPVLNEGASIAKCLDHIAGQDFAGSMEVLLVDGGSTDGSRAFLQARAEADARFRVLDNPKGLVSSALNLAIAAARGETVVRVDAHTLLDPGYLRTCLAVLRETGAENVGGPLRPVGTTPFGRSVALAMGSRFGVGTAPFRFAERRREVDTVYLGAFPRRLFERVGGFDETLLRNQDYEMNHRIRRAGGRIVVDPAVVCRYLTRPDAPSLWRQYFSYGYWKTQMLRKHPRSIKLRQLAPPAFVSALAGSAVFSGIGLATGRTGLVLAAALPVGLWLLAALATTALAALRHGLGPSLRLPAVFAIIHLAWGLGFWKGWRRPPVRPAGAAPPGTGRL